MDGFCFYNCTIKGKDIYFVDGKVGFLGKINIATGHITVLKNIDSYSFEYYDCLINVGNTLFGCSVSGKKMLILNLDTLVCEQVDIGCHAKPWDNFITMVSYNLEIFIFPKNKKEVLVYNIREKQLTKCLYDAIVSDILSFGCVIDDTVWLFPENGQEYISFRLTDKTFKTYRAEKAIRNGIHCSYGEDVLYILDKFGGVSLLDLQQGSIRVLVHVAGEEEQSEKYCRLVYANKKLFMLPSQGKDIEIYDTERKCVNVYDKYPTGFRYANVTWSKYYGYCEDNKNIYYAMRAANHVMQISKDSGEIQWIKPYFSNEDKELQTILKLCSIFKDQEINLIECIKDKLVGFRNNNSVKDNGEKIWGALK